MSNTQLLSFRIPIDVLAKIDAEAQRDGRSRSAVLTRILQHTTFSDAGLIFTGMVDSGPVAQPAERCTQSGHTGFQRADGYWCTTCRRMYP